RDKAFIDMVGHQGNDFQITDEFWHQLNALTAQFDQPGRFVCLPGYEWSGNTGMGGDRNVFFRREGRPIRRSSHILVEGEATMPGASSFGAIGGLSCYFMPELTRDALFEALRKRHHYGTTGARIFLDVRGRFAENVTGFSEDPKLGPAQEFPMRQAMMGDII